MPSAIEQTELIEEELDENGCEKLFIAVLAGAAVGAIAALLLAPDRGAETRRKLGEHLTRCCAKCREKLQPLLHCACGEGTAEEGSEAD
jgi:gas vesicle protein